MIALSSAGTVTISIFAVVTFIILLVIWRVMVHDRTIRRIRLGVFYERERDGDDRESG